jgi:hypothetical protein
VGDYSSMPGVENTDLSIRSASAGLGPFREMVPWSLAIPQSQS